MRPSASDYELYILYCVIANIYYSVWFMISTRRKLFLGPVLSKGKLNNGLFGKRQMIATLYLFMISYTVQDQLFSNI